MEQSPDTELDQIPVQDTTQDVEHSTEQEHENEMDERYANSTAYQAIKELNQVDKDIAKMLSLASSSVLLLSLPQTDNAAGNSEHLPKGEERSEQFVEEIGEYFQLLDTIQEKIREAIARVRQYRINPSVIDAPPPNFIPPTFGVGSPLADPLPEDPQEDTISPDGTMKAGMKGKSTVRDRGLQETRVERDAWKRLYGLLKNEKERRMEVNKAEGVGAGEREREREEDKDKTDDGEKRVVSGDEERQDSFGVWDMSIDSSREDADEIRT